MQYVLLKVLPGLNFHREGQADTFAVRQYVIGQEFHQYPAA
jgi:hypothetical protein